MRFRGITPPSKSSFRTLSACLICSSVSGVEGNRSDSRHELIEPARSFTWQSDSSSYQSSSWSSTVHIDTYSCLAKIDLVLRWDNCERGYATYQVEESLQRRQEIEVVVQCVLGDGSSLLLPLPDYPVDRRPGVLKVLLAVGGVGRRRRRRPGPPVPRAEGRCGRGR